MLHNSASKPYVTKIPIVRFLDSNFVKMQVLSCFAMTTKWSILLWYMYLILNPYDIWYWIIMIFDTESLWYLILNLQVDVEDPVAATDGVEVSGTGSGVVTERLAEGKILHRLFGFGTVRGRVHAGVFIRLRTRPWVHWFQSYVITLGLHIQTPKNTLLFMQTFFN